MKNCHSIVAVFVWLLDIITNLQSCFMESRLNIWNSLQQEVTESNNVPKGWKNLQPLFEFLFMHAGQDDQRSGWSKVSLHILSWEFQGSERTISPHLQHYTNIGCFMGALHLNYQVLSITEGLDGPMVWYDMVNLMFLCWGALQMQCTQSLKEEYLRLDSLVF